MRRYNDITHTTTGGNAQTTAWLPVDNNIVAFNLGIHVVNTTGTVTYTVQGTLDDIQDSAITPVAFSLPITALTNTTATAIGNLTMPVKAVRLTQTGTGTTVTRIVQQGIV